MHEPEQLQSMLQSPNIDQRAAAAEGLCLAGENAACAVVDLVRACGDEDSVRVWAVAALEEMGPPPADSLDQLAELVPASDSVVSYWAITMLGRLGPAAASCQRDLTAIISKSSDATIRQRAAWAMGRIGATGDEAICALRQATEASDPRLARLARNSLEQLRGAPSS